MFFTYWTLDYEEHRIEVDKALIIIIFQQESLKRMWRKYYEFIIKNC